MAEKSYNFRRALNDGIPVEDIARVARQRGFSIEEIRAEIDLAQSTDAATRTGHLRTQPPSETSHPLTGEDVARTWDVGVNAFGHGMREPIDALAQGAVRLPGLGLDMVAPDSAAAKYMQGQVKNVDEIASAARERAKVNAARAPGSAAMGQIAGNLAVTGPLGARLYPSKGLGAAMGQGAFQGLATPVEDPDSYGLSKATQVGIGGIGGGLAHGAVRLGSKMIQPNAQKGARELVDEGVDPTVGQVIGGNLRKTEERLKSAPLVGGAIVNREKSAREAFHKSLLNRALRPLGIKAKRAGYEGMDDAYNAVSARYEKLVPKLTAKYDDRFAIELEDIRALAGNMKPEHAAQFNKIIDGDIMRHIDNSQTGTILGSELKRMETKLGQTFARFRRSPDPDDQLMADAAQELQAMLRRMAARNTPAHAKELAKLNRSWARLRRVGKAVKATGHEEGLPTPGQYQRAIKGSETSSLNYERGRGMDQDYSRGAQRVLGNKEPDSGTAARNWLLGGLGAAGVGSGGLSAAMGDPYIMAPAGGALGLLGAGAALYSKPAQQALVRYILRNPGPASRAARGLLNSITPAMGTLGGKTAVESGKALVE